MHIRSHAQSQAQTRRTPSRSIQIDRPPSERCHSPRCRPSTPDPPLRPRPPQGHARPPARPAHPDSHRAPPRSMAPPAARAAAPAQTLHSPAAAASRSIDAPPPPTSSTPRRSMSRSTSPATDDPRAPSRAARPTAPPSCPPAPPPEMLIRRTPSCCPLPAWTAHCAMTQRRSQLALGSTAERPTRGAPRPARCATARPAAQAVCDAPRSAVRCCQPPVDVPRIRTGSSRPIQRLWVARFRPPRTRRSCLRPHPTRMIRIALRRAPARIL